MYKVKNTRFIISLIFTVVQLTNFRHRDNEGVDKELGITVVVFAVVLSIIFDIFFSLNCWLLRTSSSSSLSSVDLSMQKPDIPLSPYPRHIVTSSSVPILLLSVWRAVLKFNNFFVSVLHVSFPPMPTPTVPLFHYHHHFHPPPPPKCERT